MNNLKTELIEKNQALYGQGNELLNYFLKTKENFLYRYLETSSDKNIKIVPISKSIFEASSFEDNLGHALKISNPVIKNLVKDLAKKVPKEEKPKVKLTLLSNIENLKPENGEIVFTASVNCDFPEFKDTLATTQTLKFKYNDIMDFRKNLALKFEDICQLFI